MLPDWLALTAVQYPGRQDRLRHPRPPSLLALADEVTAALSTCAEPFVFFGHSLGASVAFEVTRRVAAAEPGRVRHLFVSGRTGPCADRKLGKHLLSDDALWQDMLSLGGTESELANLPDLKSLVVPTLRGDYTLLEEYDPDTAMVLSCPVTAFVGADDAEVDEDETKAWARCTSGRFSLRVFAGDHFYLTQHRAAVVEAILAELADAPR